LGKYEQALVDLDKAIELQPRDAVTYYWRASVYAQLGQYELALADLEKALPLATDPARKASIQQAIEALRTQ
jgi:tetratricopeptide (TPR) repeat protein